MLACLTQKVKATTCASTQPDVQVPIEVRTLELDQLFGHKDSFDKLVPSISRHLHQPLL